MKKHNLKNKQREFFTTISFFLLDQEILSKLFWNLKSVKYSPSDRTLEIGINTLNSKYGTTLTQLRKTSKSLSKYLYESGLVYTPVHVKFFIDKREEQLESINSLIERIEEGMQTKLKVA